MVSRSKKSEIEGLEREREELRAQLAALSEESVSMKWTTAPLTDDDLRLAKETRKHLDNLRTAHATLKAANRGGTTEPGTAAHEQAPSRSSMRRARRRSG